MIEDKDPAHYGISRDDVFARATSPYTKEGLFAAACTELYARVFNEYLSTFAEVRSVFEMINGEPPVDNIHASEAWDFDLCVALGEHVPEMYQHHLGQAFPDTDLAAATIAGWVVNGARHPFVEKPGQFLAKFGITAQDYADPVREADAETFCDGVCAQIDAIFKTVVSVPATREDVAQAWIFLGQATEVDQGELAKNLGISRSTVSNYANGKTAAKCTVAQAATLAAECHHRAGLLTAAANVFERVV